MLLPIYEDDHFVVTPCSDIDIPGYLILCSKTSASRLSQLSPAALYEFAPLVAALESQIIEKTQAEHVYLLRFSEGLGAVHFHVFPRTAALAAEWLRSHRDVPKGIVGEDLFSWARRTKKLAPGHALSEHVNIIADEMRQTLLENPF